MASMAFFFLPFFFFFLDFFFLPFLPFFLPARGRDLLHASTALVEPDSRLQPLVKAGVKAALLWAVLGVHDLADTLLPLAVPHPLVEVASMNEVLRSSRKFLVLVQGSGGAVLKVTSAVPGDLAPLGEPAVTEVLLGLHQAGVEGVLRLPGLDHLLGEKVGLELCVACGDQEDGTHEDNLHVYLHLYDEEPPC